MWIFRLQVYIMPDWFPRAIEALAEGTAGSYFGIFAMKCTEVDPVRSSVRLSHIAAVKEANLQLYCP